MQASLTLATWLWLVVPMLMCVALSLATYLGSVAKRRR